MLLQELLKSVYQLPLEVLPTLLELTGQSKGGGGVVLVLTLESCGFLQFLDEGFGAL